MLCGESSSRDGMLQLHSSTSAVYRIADALCHFLFSFRVTFIAAQRTFDIFLLRPYAVTLPEICLLAAVHFLSPCQAVEGTENRRTLQQSSPLHHISSAQSGSGSCGFFIPQHVDISLLRYISIGVLG